MFETDDPYESPIPVLLCPFQVVPGPLGVAVVVIDVAVVSVTGVAVGVVDGDADNIDVVSVAVLVCIGCVVVIKVEETVMEMAIVDCSVFVMRV